MAFAGFLVFLVGILAVVVQMYLADKDGFFTPQQMLAYHSKGLPMVWHFGIMWGDIFFIAPLAGLMVAWYGNQWTTRQILIVAAIALVLSAVMHWQYANDPIQNSHAHDGRLTSAAYVHFAYMWGAFTIIGLFFFCTTGLTPQFVITTSVLLWVHVVLGTHLIVKLWSPPWFLPQPAADTTTLVVWFSSASALVSLSWWALR